MHTNNRQTNKQTNKQVQSMYLEAPEDLVDEKLNMVVSERLLAYDVVQVGTHEVGD